MIKIIITIRSIHWHMNECIFHCRTESFNSKLLRSHDNCTRAMEQRKPSHNCSFLQFNWNYYLSIWICVSSRICTVIGGYIRQWERFRFTWRLLVLFGYMEMDRNEITVQMHARSERGCGRDAEKVVHQFRNFNFLFRYGHVIVSVFHFLFVCGPELGRDHNDVFCDGLNVRHLWTGRHTLCKQTVALLFMIIHNKFISTRCNLRSVHSSPIHIFHFYLCGPCLLAVAVIH